MVVDVLPSERLKAYSDAFFSIVATLMVSAMWKRERGRKGEARHSPASDTNTHASPTSSTEHTPLSLVSMQVIPLAHLEEDDISDAAACYQGNDCAEWIEGVCLLAFPL